MAEFKKGDKVRLIDRPSTREDHEKNPECYPKPGTIGTVCDDSDIDGSTRVEWPQAAIQGDRCDWWALNADLELVENAAPDYYIRVKQERRMLVIINAVNLHEASKYAATLLKFPGDPERIIPKRVEREFVNFILLHELDKTRNVIRAMQIPDIKAFIAEASGVFVSTPELEGEDAFLRNFGPKPPALSLGSFAFFVGCCCFDGVTGLFNELVGLREAFKQLHFSFTSVSFLRLRVC